jgi:dsRNA-specific ribonuclease
MINEFSPVYILLTVRKRLEFLGDSVVTWLVTLRLYQLFDFTEGSNQDHDILR